MNHQGFHLDDLSVVPVSQSLEGVKIDLVITGSIAATESVKFIRALRRLGATVFPWVTQSALQFTTTTALEWASNQKVQSSFSGLHSHIAQGDVCVVAPCTASFASRINQGICDTPTSALVASYLGQKKLVLVLPVMHQSLAASPFVFKNISELTKNFVLLSAVHEESKFKFPESSSLADQISHNFRYHQTSRTQQTPKRVIVCYGGSRSMIDPVRCIANISTGKLGSQLCAELFRHGIRVYAIRGSSEEYTESVNHEIRVSSNDDYLDAIKGILSQNHEAIDSIILASALLDYGVDSPQKNKIDSKKEDSLELKLTKQPKIIAKIRDSFKGSIIAFKLLSKHDDLRVLRTSLKKDYIDQYQLSGLYLNFIDDLRSGERKGVFFHPTKENIIETQIPNTQELTHKICDIVFEKKDFVHA